MSDPVCPAKASCRSLGSLNLPKCAGGRCGPPACGFRARWVLILWPSVAREVEDGETIVVTRNGRPLFDLVPHKKRGGIDFAAGEAYLKAKGIERREPYIADDFDDPLPEDFLLRPLPPAR